MAGNPRRVRIDDWGKSRHSSWRAAARSAGRTVRRKSKPLRELFAPRCRLAAYFNWVEIDENVLLSLVPRPLTTAMIAMEIPAAIKPYAPDSSLRKALSVCMAPIDSTAAVIVLLLRSQKGPGRCSVQPGQGPVKEAGANPLPN
jgi:hypothetical protein